MAIDLRIPARLARTLVAEAPDRPALTVRRRHARRARNSKSAPTRSPATCSLVGVNEGDLVTMALPNSAGLVRRRRSRAGSSAPSRSRSARGCRRASSPRSSSWPTHRSCSAPRRPSASTTGRSSTSAAWLAAHPDPITGDDPLPDVVSQAWKAPTSGGSTGRPKLIVSGDPAQLDADIGPPLGHHARRRARDARAAVPQRSADLVAVTALLHGNHVVVLPKFDAAATLDAIDRTRPTSSTSSPR